MGKNSKETLRYIYIIRSMNDDYFFLILKAMLEIIEEDVHETLALPMGPLEIHVASAYEQKINTPNSLKYGGEGTQKVRIMVKQILQRGDYREEFKRDFVKEKQRLMVSHNEQGRTDAVEQNNNNKKKFLGELVNPWRAWNGQDNRQNRPSDNHS
ncbi:hypothetical protein Cgig2_002765 [Carnegiea gigantea]|uniref:Uncharacterized protein n=1 Tax=Carnegiea gigantea TaxID=171969 RepID=A0A9Q1GZK4_9CARY|nr:hypothetical protein Cgig2_002765 [Carnegiea gigantea]